MCPSVRLFVQLRLLRGDKNDLPTCTFGQDQEPRAEATLGAVVGAKAEVGRQTERQSDGTTDWPTRCLWQIFR